MSTITDFIGKFFTKTTSPNAEMAEMGEAADDGRVYFDNGANQSNADNGQGGSLMIYNEAPFVAGVATTGSAGWYGVNLTTSTSTSTTTTTTTSTSTTTTTT